MVQPRDPPGAPNTAGVVMAGVVTLRLCKTWLWKIWAIDIDDLPYEMVIFHTEVLNCQRVCIDIYIYHTSVFTP